MRTLPGRTRPVSWPSTTSCTRVWSWSFDRIRDPLLTATFVIGLPGLLVMMTGSTMLGIALLRRRAVLRAAGWLLALTIPLAFLIAMVTSMGSRALPVMFAFGLLGRRIARDEPVAPIAWPDADRLVTAVDDGDPVRARRG